MHTSGIAVLTDGRRPRQAGADLLIITARPDEYDAARAATGATPWQDRGAGGPAPYSTTRYPMAGGTALSVALARPAQLDGLGTGPVATMLTGELRPTCLAMSGVCAGNPAATTAGDVIVAAPAGTGVRADPDQFPQETRWTRTAERFDPAGLPSHGSATDEEAEIWYLARLYRGQDPRTHPARPRYSPGAAWRRRLAQMTTAGLITWRDGRWELTGTGRDRIEGVLDDEAGGPQRLPFQVHTGPMTSGSATLADPDIWTTPEAGRHRILGLDREAATIATVAHEHQVPHWLVAKGVLDHAGFDRADRFTTFAARASAEVLFALVGRLLAPSSLSPGPLASPAGIPDPVQLEIVRRLTYDWPDLADVVGAPAADTRRFRGGEEARELWEWLASRGRLGDLPGALEEIGRGELASLLHPYL